MTNHIHLLLTPGEPRAIPKLMQGLGRSYIQAINRHYQRSGPLWEGRYKASLVQADDYFLACQRYIELNPVRAGLVTAPAEYVFSSYLCNALGQVDYLITPHPVYQALGGSNKARQTTYRKLFDSSISASTIEAIRKTTNACRVLGDDRFIDQVEAMLQRRIRSNPRGRPVGSKSS